MHRHIPREALPAEYGGFQPPFNNTQWRQQIIRDEQYFTRLESYKMDFTAQSKYKKTTSVDSISNTSSKEANKILNELMQPKDDPTEVIN